MAKDNDYRQQFKEGLKQTTGAKITKGMGDLIEKGKNFFSDDDKKEKEQEVQKRRSQSQLPTLRR